MRTLALLAVGFIGALPSAARAGVGADDGVDAVIARVVRARYGAVHRCYRRALAEDRLRGGTVFLRVTLGAGDRVGQVKVERDELKHAATVACLLAAVRGWRVRGARAAGAPAGSEIVIPLTFKPVKDQFAVWRADAPEAQLAPGVRVRRLLHAKNVGRTPVELRLLILAPRARLAIEPIAADRGIFVLRGGGRLRSGGAGGVLRPKAAAWVPPAHYGKLLAGSKGLEVLEFIVSARTKSGGSAMVVARSTELRWGPLRARPLLDERRTRQKRFYLGRLAIPRSGKALKAHAHLGVEAVYVLRGKGTATVAGRTAPMGSGQAMLLPAGVPHAVTTTSPTEVVQVFAPAGPEARFHK